MYDNEFFILFCAILRQYEQMGLMANEIKNYTLLYESFAKAAENMITSGTRDSAGVLLERGAT